MCSWSGLVAAPIKDIPMPFSVTIQPMTPLNATMVALLTGMATTFSSSCTAGDVTNAEVNIVLQGYAKYPVDSDPPPVTPL